MYGQGAATSSLDILPRQNSAPAERVPRRADPSSDLEKPTWTSGAVPNIGNEGVPTPVVSGASLSKSARGRRGAAPALSVGTVIYLVSVGLVATAIVGVFLAAVLQRSQASGRQPQAGRARTNGGGLDWCHRLPSRSLCAAPGRARAAAG